MEENEKNTKGKEREEFEAEKESHIFANKYLQDAKAHEEKELLNKKHRLKQLFEEAIAEKRRFEVKQKYEEEFEDRAIEVYESAKERIKKMHKKVMSQRKEDIENRARLISERHRELMQSSKAIEDEILEKALAEKEARRKEQEEARREREIKMRKELRDFRTETVEKKSREVEEEKDWKLWEMALRFKKAESDKLMDIEDRKREWNDKMEYKDSLRRSIMEREAQLNEEKYFEAKEAAYMKEIIEKENKRVLDYAEEVINESTGVRPLYPILKALKECKKEMNLLPLRKKEEIIDTKPSTRRRRPRVCTKIVPEEQICYLK
ncbi:uncharacterized protein LOC128882477 [Hylaeus volcanicus]|uniref:uncharacterized protein LOC128882477 n=1 Tax=Hylaeus volcanicus TaxID=313075 RepID=UPI0023B79C2C|nr:uncharacterized protein LOC128882477 [Hylaeus volcanicus]